MPWPLIALGVSMLVLGALARALDVTRKQVIKRGSRVVDEPLRYRTEEDEDNSWLDSVRVSESNTQKKGPTRADALASKAKKPKVKQEDYDDFFETDEDFFETDDAFAEFDDLFKDD